MGSSFTNPYRAIRETTHDVNAVLFHDIVIDSLSDGVYCGQYFILVEPNISSPLKNFAITANAKFAFSLQANIITIFYWEVPFNNYLNMKTGIHYSIIDNTIKITETWASPGVGALANIYACVLLRNIGN